MSAMGTDLFLWQGGGTDQRLVIKEAFAGDDVVADFLKEKNKVEQEGKSQTVDLLLPGWGEWSGTGLKPSAKKRKRYVWARPRLCLSTSLVHRGSAT